MDTESGRVLVEAATAVADDLPVAWEDLERRDPAATGSLANLRLVAAVASAHRERLDAAPRADIPILFRWGHLEVLEKIGQGSFGEVFRAYDPVLDQRVALKLLHPGLRGRSGGDLLTEARRLAKVRHPNVVVAHGVDRHQGRVGVWTDLVDGETLEQYLTREGVLGAEEAARIGLDLARALAAIHGAGLVHGDVKPANVMRERGGRIVLMDFGAAAEPSPGGGDTPAVCGTPLVMAPELFRGGAPTALCDIYSLGVVLYRLLTGRFPVEGADVPELARRHAGGSGTPLVDARPDVPAGLAQVVERALSPDPGHRHASAGALERDLARWLAGQESDGDREAVGVGVAVAGRWRFITAAAAITALALAGVVAHREWAPGETDPALPVRALAVLPFKALDGGSHEDGVGLGLADAVISRLSQVPEVRVSPTSAVLRFTGARPRAETVARSLGVDAVLDGRIQRSGERVRITVQLLGGRDGTPLWAEVFDQRSEDVFALQDDIAERLAVALQLRLTAGPTSPPRGDATADPEARVAYLMGRHFLGQHTVTDTERAVADFSRAIELDPQFAPAWAGLAEAYIALAGLESSGVPPDTGYGAARQAAERALALDDTLAAAHRAVGLIHLRHDWDWRAAERAFEQALALEPESALAHLARGELASLEGRHGEAVNLAGRAVDLEPLSLTVLVGASSLYREAGWLDDAARLARRAAQLDGAFAPAHLALAAVYEERDMAAATVSQWQSAMTLSGWSQAEVSELGRAFAEQGLAGAWRWRLRRLQEDASSRYVPPALLARAHAALGEREEALRRLEDAFAVKDEFLLRVRMDRWIRSLRGDPRSAVLEERLALGAAGDRAVASVRPADPPAAPLRVDARLFRERGGRPEALAGGALIRPGDRLYCTVSSPEPLFVYVLNEDQAGQAFALFPLPGFDLANPLPPGQLHRLPGRRDGMAQDWVVTSSGGRETVLLVGAREPIPSLEREMASWRQASSGRPVERDTGGSTAVRGIGGLGARPPVVSRRGRLAAVAADLSDLEGRGQVWLQEFVLTSGPVPAGARP